jgi:sigma-54 dependent transcriptional regulator, flagellar regulatory protein
MNSAASIRTNLDDREPQDSVRALLVGDSAAMQALRQLVRLMAASPAPALVLGPTGSGKEVVARAIHAAGGPDRPFVAVNCAAIPAELIESELFGHEKGSFTGASERRIGRFEAASGGTLFLDEIGDMPAAAQVRLLRVIEERMFERVGGGKPISFTGRIICATHCDLTRQAAAGRFREDLWFRIAVLPLTVPSLAARRGDIPALVAALAQRIDGAPRFGAGAMDRLMQHGWPGNVRELRNLIERAAILHRGGDIDTAAAEGLIALGASTGPRLPGQDVVPAIPDPDPDLRGLLDSVEMRQLTVALEQSGWRVSDTARRVGLSRTTFIDRMRKHGINRPGRVPVEYGACARTCDGARNLSGRALVFWL